MNIPEARISTHFWVPRKYIKNLGDLKGDLTIRDRYDGNEFKTYRITDSWFGVPLISDCRLHFYPEITHDLRVEGNPIEFELKTELWPGQKDVIKRLTGYLHIGVSNVILESPTGSGKTVMLIEAIRKIGRTALIVVPVSNLVKQWQDRFIEHTNLPPEKIGIFENGEGDFKGKDVVIGLIHTIVMNKWGRGFRRYFGQIWYDELHTTLPPKTFGPSINMFPCKYRGGATATVQRKDGLHKIYDLHMGELKLVGKDEGRMKPRVVMINYPEWSGTIPHWCQTKIQRQAGLLSLLAGNEHRNKLILRRIKKRVKQGHRVVVLSARTEQLQWLQSELTGINCGLYVRRFPIDGKTKSGRQKYKEMKKTEREAVAKDPETRVLLATYGMIRLGTDLKDLSAIIFATPQSDPTQSKGRIERFQEGKKEPVIDDFVDTYYKEAKGWAEGRKRVYRKEGLKLREIDILST